MLKRIFLYIFSLLAFPVLNVIAGNAVPWWYMGGSYLLYTHMKGSYKDAPYYYEGETLKTDLKQETIDGKQYYVFNVTLWGPFVGDQKPDTHENIMHIRQEGQRVLVRYDEYKQLMKDRNHDMSTFDELCQFEVTDDGEMVLYDFGMQVGDKFRSVAGKEDVYVVMRYKDYPSYYTQQGNRDVIIFSNGCYIAEGVGYKGMNDGFSGYPMDAPQGNFFDYLNPSVEYGMRLEEFRWDGTWIYENNALDGSNSSVKQIEATDVPAKVYNLQGQQLEKTPKKGVYIQNGKKVIVK